MFVHLWFGLKTHAYEKVQYILNGPLLQSLNLAQPDLKVAVGSVIILLFIFTFCSFLIVILINSILKDQYKHPTHHHRL